MELITAKYLLPMDSEAIEDGAIVTEVDKIIDIGKSSELKEKYKEAKVEESPNSILMPGLVNAHVHLDFAGSSRFGSETLETGAPDYIDWLLMNLEHRDKAPIQQTLVRVQESIKHIINSGTTCVGDMTCFEGTFKIIDEVGLRAVIFPEIYAGAERQAQDRFEAALALIDKYIDINTALISVGLGPYAPFLLSKNILSIISQHAKSTSIPIQIHAAESFAEMEFFYDSKGSIADKLFPAIGWGDDLPPPHHKTPIQFLGEIGFLDAGPTIVGGLHLGVRDFSILARNMCRVVCCPRMNHFLGHGNFPFSKLSDNGIAVGFGTENLDGPGGLNMWEELKFVQNDSTSNVPTAKQILQMATLGGARALSLENVTGSLTAGKQADYILLDIPEFPTTPLIYEAVIRHTKPVNVRKVVVAGEILKTL